jgi:Glycosyl hydrolase family 65, N-terminal domain
VSAPGGEMAEAAFDPARLAANESVFAVGNGYLGLRGAPEEGGPQRAADPGRRPPPRQSPAAAPARRLIPGATP